MYAVDMVYLPDHSHCQYCGNPTPYGQDFCDDDCRSLHEAEEHVEKMKDMRFYIIIGASLIALAIVGVLINVL